MSSIVTVTVDIGTSVVPLALPGAAIAYAIEYQQGQEATLHVRFFTEADKAGKKNNTPAAVFTALVKDMPGVWSPTYSSLDSLLSCETVESKYEFSAIKLKFDQRTYSWTIEKDAVRDFIMSLAMGRTAAPIDDIVEKRPSISL